MVLLSVAPLRGSTVTAKSFSVQSAEKVGSVARVDRVNESAQDDGLPLHAKQKRQQTSVKIGAAGLSQEQDANPPVFWGSVQPM